MAGETGGVALPVYFSYAPQDEVLCRALRDQLIPLERQGLIKGWHRDLLAPGVEQQQEIAHYFHQASLILVLLSPDYISSDICFAEMEAALARSHTGATLLVPILLRPVDYEALPVALLQPLPLNRKAVSLWTSRDRAYAEIAISIRRLLGQERAEPSLIPLVGTQLWNIPAGRNRLFMGRDDLLEQLHARLVTRHAATLTQSQALSGLGGVGKTQTAIEYAYRYQQDYHYVLWVNAVSAETLGQSLSELAILFRLPAMREQARVVAAVKNWFATHEGWLVIFDNADDLVLVEDYLPTRGNGHLLLTTRAQVPGVLSESLEVDPFSEKEGMLLLMRRAGLLTLDAPLTEALTADLEVARAIVREMDGLPLALDQAGAYIEETRCSLVSYLTRYQEWQATLLGRRGGTGKQHPEPVAATWALSFARVEASDPLAADILRVCAFLAPDAIPTQLLLDGAAELEDHFRALANDVGLLDEAVGTLLRFSLVKRRQGEASLSLHRLVQVVLRESLAVESRRMWAERVVRAVSRTFPNSWQYTGNWARYQTYMPHVQACIRLIEQWDFAFAEAARLWNALGSYLQVQAQYPDAQASFQRALAIGEQSLGPQHPDLATWYNDLANLYWVQDHNSEAEPLYQRALAIGEQTLGSEHPNLATWYNNLAALYEDDGKNEKAESLYQRALSIREQQLGPEHPDTAQILNNLANVYYAQRRYEEAESLYQRALAIREKAQEVDHLELAMVLTNLANLYHRDGRNKKADLLYQRAVALGKQASGSIRPDTIIFLTQIANSLRRRDHYSEAESLYRRAIAIGKQTLGPEHPNLATPYIELARLYENEESYEEAETFYLHALVIREQCFGSNDPKTMWVRRQLDEIQIKQGLAGHYPTGRWPPPEAK